MQMKKNVFILQHSFFLLMLWISKRFVSLYISTAVLNLKETQIRKEVRVNLNHWAEMGASQTLNVVQELVTEDFLQFLKNGVFQFVEVVFSHKTTKK